MAAGGHTATRNLFFRSTPGFGHFSLWCRVSGIVCHGPCVSINHDSCVVRHVSTMPLHCSRNLSVWFNATIPPVVVVALLPCRARLVLRLRSLGIAAPLAGIVDSIWFAHLVGTRVVGSARAEAVERRPVPVSRYLSSVPSARVAVRGACVLALVGCCCKVAGSRYVFAPASRAREKSSWALTIFNVQPYTAKNRAPHCCVLLASRCAPFCGCFRRRSPPECPTSTSSQDRLRH